jgi:hypothetical protein
MQVNVLVLHTVFLNEHSAGDWPRLTYCICLNEHTSHDVFILHTVFLNKHSAGDCPCLTYCVFLNEHNAVSIIVLHAACVSELILLVIAPPLQPGGLCIS